MCLVSAFGNGQASARPYTGSRSVAGVARLGEALLLGVALALVSVRPFESGRGRGANPKLTSALAQALTGDGGSNLRQ